MEITMTRVCTGSWQEQVTYRTSLSREELVRATAEWFGLALDEVTDKYVADYVFEVESSREYVTSELYAHDTFEAFQWDEVCFDADADADVRSEVP